jgi:ABC-type sugar transport system permease subunit
MEGEALMEKLAISKSLKQETMIKAKQRRWGSPSMTGYLFLVPALFILALVGFYPLVRTVILSFYNLNLTNPVTTYVGLSNYIHLLDDIWFKVAYKNTWIFTVVSVAAETLLGLLIALLLDKKFPGRGWVRASILIPWAIPTVISADMWKWLFNSEYGLINFLLLKIGLIDTYQNWLGSPTFAFWCAVIADIWKTTPFMALILLAGLQTIPEEIYEAGQIDGVSSWQRFRFITLPLLSPTIVMAILLRSLDAFRVFDLIFVLTGGGPANSTEVLSSYAYKTTFSSTQIGYGASMSTMMALSVFVLAMVMLFWLRHAYARQGGKE